MFVHVPLDRRTLEVDGGATPSLSSCPTGISRARGVHAAIGQSCRRSGRQPGFNEVRPGSKGCRDWHLRRNADDVHRTSPHRDRRADLRPSIDAFASWTSARSRPLQEAIWISEFHTHGGAVGRPIPLDPATGTGVPDGRVGAVAGHHAMIARCLMTTFPRSVRQRPEPSP